MDRARSRQPRVSCSWEVWGVGVRPLAAKSGTFVHVEAATRELLLGCVWGVGSCLLVSEGGALVHEEAIEDWARRRQLPLTGSSCCCAHG
eukprot:351233-Chlamydomonas_euryale.AAC.3